MNERIKQLIFEAVNFRLDPDSNSYEAQVCPEDLESLAELIVRECAALAKSKSEYIESMLTDGRGDQVQIQSLAWWFEEFEYEIKKHFGVEE